MATGVAAILMLEYLGQEGDHVFVDALLGHVTPSGKLPFAVRREDLPHDLWRGQLKLQRDGITPGVVDLFGRDESVVQMVARDGFEPPTPAFSGLRSTPELPGRQLTSLPNTKRFVTC